MKKAWKYIYGPVSSWRLGRSLGIDILSGGKACNYNCIYCQLGETVKHTTERKIFVPTKEIIKELELFPKVKIDYITFSGSGEPTLARNLGAVIKAAKKIRKKPVAVLTNSLLLHKTDVRNELAQADFVMAKLDSFSEESFKSITRPEAKVKFEDVYYGILKFRKQYKKRLALQIMFIEENKNDAHKLAFIARELRPDEVQLNTPLRQCPVKALSKKEMSAIKKCFRGIKVKTVYEAKRKKVTPVSKEDTLRRRRSS